MKSGLDYFPLDCIMDDSVKLVEAELGLEGFALIIKLWQDIYKGEGYYKKFDKDVQLLFAREVNVTPKALASFLYVALDRGIFNKEIYEKYQVLTSKGIQERFLKSIGRRKKVNLISEYILYDIAESENVSKINVCKNEENVCKNEKNADIFKQSKRKESKREESKAEESMSDRDQRLLLEEKLSPKVTDEVETNNTSSVSPPGCHLPLKGKAYLNLF